MFQKLKSVWKRIKGSRLWVLLVGFAGAVLTVLAIHRTVVKARQASAMATSDTARFAPKDSDSLYVYDQDKVIAVDLKPIGVKSSEVIQASRVKKDEEGGEAYVEVIKRNPGNTIDRTGRISH